MIIHKSISQDFQEARLEIADNNTRFAIILDSDKKESSWYFVNIIGESTSGYLNSISDLKEMHEYLGKILNVN